MEYIHWIFILAYFLFILIAMIGVLMDNKEPAKTMAWLLVLFFLPVIGIVLYIFFGQNMRRERTLGHQSMNELDKHSMLEFVEQRDFKIGSGYESLAKLFINQDMSLPFKDNDIDIYTDGTTFFQNLIRAIGNAHSSIHIDIYIIDDDPLGRLITDLLIDKARQGVEVRLIYDDVGSWNTPSSFFERLRKGGVDVRSFMPVRFPKFTSKVNYRNHRKVVVIDGTVGFIGGMNIAQRYVKGVKHQKWRDTHIRMAGNGVYGLQRMFLIDWYFVAHELITAREYYPAMPHRLINDCIVQTVTSSPASEWANIMQGYVKILHCARKYVYMESPYFLPNEPVLFAMQEAALAGIDVKLMLPMKGDSMLVTLASRTYLKKVLDAGVEIYFYKEGFNHSKMLVCDDYLSTCGSTNIDFRSFEHNFETNVFVYDKAVALKMKNVFLDDLNSCDLVDTVKGIPHRPFLERLRESAVRLLSPLL